MGRAQRRLCGRRQAPDLVQAGGMDSGPGPVLRAILPHQFRRHRAHQLTDADGNHAVTFSPDKQYYVDTWSRVDLAAACAAAPHGRPEGGDGSREGRRHRLAGRRLEAAGGFRRQRPRRQDRHLGHHHPADELRSQQEISGDREHLRRAARLVRAQDVQRGRRRCSHWPSSGSSSCRSTGWAPATARRPSTTWRGRISATPAFPTASCGTRRWPRSIP